MQPEEALDGALVWVNNVSKRRLLSSLAAMKAARERASSARRRISETKWEEV